MKLQTIAEAPQRKQGKCNKHEISLPGNRIGWIRRRGEHWQADLGMIDGTRVIKSNRLWNKDDAENWARVKALELEEHGNKALNLKDDQRLDAIKAIEELAGTGATLLQAAQYFKRFKAPGITPKTIAEVVAEYIQDAQDRNLRERSLQDLRYRLSKLTEKCGNRSVTEMRRQDAEVWVKSLGLSPLSKKHFNTVAHGVFSYAIEKEYCVENPFAANSRRRKLRRDETMPEFIPVAGVEKILAAAEQHEPGIAAALAIGFFTGLRTSELSKLDWSNVNLQTNFLTVTPAMAKKRSVRQVSIPENLAVWLVPYKKDSGLVAPEGRKWRSGFDAVREKAGVKWPFNAMRHSFITYRVPLVSNINEVALEAGNSPDMIYKHYRGLATKQDAEKYFQLKPEKEGNTLQFAKQA